MELIRGLGRVDTGACVSVAAPVPFSDRALAESSRVESDRSYSWNTTNTAESVLVSCAAESADGKGGLPPFSAARRPGF